MTVPECEILKIVVVFALETDERTLYGMLLTFDGLSKIEKRESFLINICNIEHELILTVLGIKIVLTVPFAESDYYGRNVLSRIGWFDRVKLGLIEKEGKLFLSEYKKSER